MKAQLKLRHIPATINTVITNITALGNQVCFFIKTNPAIGAESVLGILKTPM